MTSFIPVDHDPFAGEREIQKITFTNEPQREVWLSCVIGGDDANLSYNESVSLKIQGELNIDAFGRALEEVVRRHEALRATISPNGETLIIYNDCPVNLDVENISGKGEQEKTALLGSFLKREMNTALNLQKGPLFKVFLHKTGERSYYFTIIKHHIIGDGWSTGVILEDLSKLYNAYSRGEKLSLEPAAQISDYAAAQASFKNSAEYKKTEDYWLDLYKDNVPVLDLPTDRPRLSPRSYKGDRIDHALSKDTVSQLKALGAKAGSSLVTTLLAAFEVFLFRATNQRDIVVGLPSSGQAATGLNDVVGHCVNLLPLKTRINPDESFADYLKKRKKEVLDAYDHQRLTFGELIKKLYIQRDASRLALVPVMFNIDIGMDNAVRFDGLDFQLISNPREYENFELYLNATGSKDGIVLEWSYNTDLFDSATIEAFHNDYHEILKEIIAAPGKRIADLAGINEGPVQVAAGPIVEIAPEQNINVLVADAVRQYGSKTAVRFNDTSLSYAQLNEQVAGLAAVLTANGAGKGTIVAISADRSKELVVCMLAVLRVGAAYLPLDPEYPHERIAFMLEDAGAALLLTNKNYKGKYTTAAKELVIEDVLLQTGKHQKQVTVPVINENDIAYVLYTSGSTGKPKGVKVTHRNLANFLLSMKTMPGIADKDKLLAITSISFDIAGLELYLPLIAGAELVIADNDATKDGRLLLGLIESKGITMMQATPSSWQMILDSGWDKRYPLKILSGGEALPKELADKLLSHGSELWNLYGPTETTIWSTIKKILPTDKQLTIGRPINNTQVYIMDEYGKPMPVNQQGELYIGGDGVADGYLNRAELSAEKFVPDVYSGKQGKLYRTGDVGKLLANGEIQCLGRIDHQVKIRGHRIELGEIESAIAGLEGVKQNVVLAREDVPGDKRLVAYVTMNAAADNTGNPTWKDRWDTLYEIGTADKQKTGTDHNIDGTLLEHLMNSDELTKQAAEWLQTSVERIKQLNAKRVYEIGSGAGQVMFELAPGVESYIATDYAQAAITNINERLAAEPEQWKHVKAAVAAADDFSAVGNARPDLVIINSVAQYFPDADYLVGVLKQAVHALKNGGCVFIGDMQGKNSLEMYHAMDHLQRASDSTSVAAFKEVVANRVRIEEEFVADPAFFYLLPKLIPQISGVNVQLRKGQSENETTKYHYDVWLYVATTVETVKPKVTYDWKDIQSKEQLTQLLKSNAGAVVAVNNIPNIRTAKDHELVQLLNAAKPDGKLADIRRQAMSADNGVHPDVIWEAGEALKYDTHVRWTTEGTDGMFDAVFIPASAKLLLPEYQLKGTEQQDIYSFARKPLANNELHIPEEVAKGWKEQLHEVLPAYMVPGDIIALKSFPLTPNAKIDRKVLPKPRQHETAKARGRTTLTANEQLVADIWSATLGLEHLNPADDFFQLGGHSLLAVKVMVAIEKKTGKRLTINTLFDNPTIEQLAAQLGDEPLKKTGANEWDCLVPIKTAGKKPPIFLIHGGELNVLLFKSINEYFDEDQPIYGIQALGLSHETDIPQTIEGIAARYINDMLKVYPSGPYAVAGYSLGGFFAFEIAKQLKEMGKEILFLGIMDTYAGNNIESGNKGVRTFNKVKRQFRKLPFFTKSFVKYPKESFEYQVGYVNRVLFRDKTQVYVPENIFTEYEKEIFRKYSAAHNAYVLKPADVQITLFRVEKRLYYIDDFVHLGWGKLALKGVNVQQIPGDHKTFLYPPNSKKFAGIIQRMLDSIS